MLEVYIHILGHAESKIKRKHELGVDATYRVIYSFVMFIDF